MARRSTNGHIPLTTLTIADMSDRDLMFAIAKVADRKTGLINPADVAEELRIQSNGQRTPAGTVSVRLSWMRTHDPDCSRDCFRHYGYLERIDPLSIGLKRKDGMRYVITEHGRDLMAGDMSKTLQRALDNTKVGTAALVLNEIMVVQGSHGDLRAFRRQYNHSYARLTGRR